MANLREEKKLWRRGYKLVAGLDEVGRGPLAGPVVAVAVVVKTAKNSKLLGGIRDSKKTTKKRREEIYKILTTSPDIIWGWGRVYPKVIDRINIWQATKLAMKRALMQAQSKLKRNIDFVILDGKMKLNLPILQKSIVKADEKVFSCAAASIIAKVKRDKIMERYHKKYPHYGFLNHKGYGTKSHLKNIDEFGASKIHRKTFAPLARSYQQKRR